MASLPIPVLLLTASRRIAVAGCAAIILMVLVACSRDAADAGGETGGGGGGKQVPAPEPPPTVFSLPEPYSTSHWAETPANEWTQKFLAAKSSEERIVLLEEKQASGPEFLASMVRLALRQPDEAVRIHAIDSARHLEIPTEITDILSGATANSMEDVAIFAIEIARTAPLESRLEVYRNAFGSPHPKVREMAVIDLMRERNKSAFESVFTGLSDPDETVRDTTREAIFKMTYQRFQSHNDAIAWWGAHAQDFNDRMVATTVLAP